MGAEPGRKPARLRAVRWRHRLEHLAFPPRCRWHGSAGDPEVQQVLPVSWSRDSAGVYYSRYPLKPGEKIEEAERGDDAGRPDVYFHKLVEAQSADRLVYKVTDHPTRVPSGQVTEDGRYLLIGLFDGYESNGMLVQDLRNPAAKPQPLFTAWDALYSFIGSKGDELYFQTTNNAPRGRVIAVDARNPAPRSLAHDRAAQRHPDRQRPLHRWPRRRRILARCAQRRAPVRREWHSGRRSEAAGDWHRDRFPGHRHEPGSVLLLLRLSIADAHHAHRRRHQHRERVPHAESARGFLAIRHRAGVLSQQGWHARADVHHTTQGCAA